MNDNSTPTNEEQTDQGQNDLSVDEEIDLSDIPEITAEQFKKMRPFKELLAERGIDYDPSAPIEMIEYREDGSTRTYIHYPPIQLDPDVRKYFPDTDAVNEALRGLIALIPEPPEESE